MPTFDVTSTVNMQEIKNAVEQVKKEISTRFDLKDSKSSIELLEKELLIVLVSDDKLKLKAVTELLSQKLGKRGVSLKSCEFGEPAPAGGDTIRQEVKIKQGLTPEELKRVNSKIKESKVKVTSQIQGDQIRVSSKKRDDLQEVIASLKAAITDLSLQYVNFRE